MLTVKNQAIVPALKQPDFEELCCNGVILIDLISNALATFQDIPSNAMSVDLTGKRVQVYIDLVTIAYTISTQRTYLSGHNATNDTFKKWKFQPDEFWKNPLRVKSMQLFASLKKQFHPKVESFQDRHTKL